MLLLLHAIMKAAAHQAWLECVWVYMCYCVWNEDLCVKCGFLGVSLGKLWSDLGEVTPIELYKDRRVK